MYNDECTDVFTRNLGSIHHSIDGVDANRQIVYRLGNLSNILSKDWLEGPSSCLNASVLTSRSKYWLEGFGTKEVPVSSFPVLHFFFCLTG